MNQDCWGKYQQPQILMTKNVEDIKDLLIEIKEETEKFGLKLSIQKLGS